MRPDRRDPPRRGEMRHGHGRFDVLRATAACLGCLLIGGCGCERGSDLRPGQQAERNDRSQMEQATVTIKGHEFQVAVARTPDEQRVGLMNVASDELGQDEGMLFVFPRERQLYFWMKNTIMPLDIAYINAQGQIVQTHTMKALDTSQYPSVRPAQYALEVHAGRLEALSIRQGDVAQITFKALKP